MIEYLSPREVADLSSLAEAGEWWPRLILEAFADDARLRLGWDAAQGERALAEVFGRTRGVEGAGVDAGRAVGRSADRGALRAALERAARWCAEHGLHLMSFEESEFGDDAAAERRWFMAVG